MKKIFILLLAGLFLIPAFAQKGKKDIVYLKSGGIVKGQVITKDLDIVKINSSGNQWVFKTADVDSVSKYALHSKLQQENGLSRDYFFDTSLGVLLGNSGNNQSAPFSFTSSLNFRVYDKFYLGAGLGAEFFNESYMPVFGQFQYKFRDTKFTPFFNLQAGYEVALEDGNRQHYRDLYYSSYSYPGTTEKLNAEGGFMINPSIGFQSFSSENFGWFFAFGYRHHQLNYSGDNGYKLETNFSRLSLKIGFIFN